MVVAVVLGVLYLASVTPVTEGVKASTWDYCNCMWLPWMAWSDCNSNCYGRRVRERQVRLTQYPGCAVFTDCASNGDGFDYSDCNEQCSNGGTPGNTACSCVAGFSGRCCTFVINCGTPTAISNGGVSYSGTNYAAKATYTCDQHYNLTGGSDVRTCQLSAVWSGQLPYCAYVNHCSSNPCQNGATCTDLLDDYMCTCVSGWSGQHCETDVQPPVMTDCPADISVNATETTLFINWTTPTFTDPLENDLHLTNNYPSPSYNFPWGDFTVQYTATKLNNGLSTECLFTVKVRPTPCDELNIPAHGARICNDWQTDFGRFCMVACDRNYMIDPENSFDMLYVCGASGNWIDQSLAPNCSMTVETIDDALYYHPEFVTYSYNTSLAESETSPTLQELFINHFSSSELFAGFCNRYPDECIPERVAVTYW